MIKCPKCGRDLPDGTAFCLNCFTSLTEKSKTVTELKKESKVSKLFESGHLKIALSSLLAVALFSGGAIALKNNLHKVKTVSAESTTLIAVTNTNGEAVTNSSGEVLTEAVVEVTDANGEAVTNEDGSKVYQAVVPVTNASGESVTNGSGEQVYEVLTAAKQEDKTEATTKKSLFDRLFNRDEQSTANGKTNTERTTEINGEGSATVTEKPINSENTTVSTTESTVVSTTESTTQATQPSTQTTENANEDDFEYDLYNNYVIITKYKGNNKNVAVPAKIDGIPVGYIGEGFSGKTIEAITFSSNIYGGLKYLNHCSSLQAVYFDGASQYHSVDGVAFAGNTLVYYPAGKKDNNYTTPEFCTVISQNAIKDNPYLKTFTISSGNIQYAHNILGNFTGCTSLTAINTKKDMVNLKTVDGVLFYLQSPSSDTGDIHFIYPAGKQDSYFEFPKLGTIIVQADYFCGNPYLKTIKFKSNIGGFSVLSVHNSNNRPINLERIYLPDNEKQHAFLEDGYNAWCFQSHNITVEFY